VVALEEATTLVSAVNGEFSPEIAQNLAEQAFVKHRQAEVIRKLLQQLEPFRTE
jgi:hypothetical protein